MLPALGTDSGKRLRVEGGFPWLFLPSFPGVLEPGTNSSDWSISSGERLRTGSVSLNPSRRDLVMFTLLGALCILLANKSALFQGCQSAQD